MFALQNVRVRRTHARACVTPDGIPGTSLAVDTSASQAWRQYRLAVQSTWAWAAVGRAANTGAYILDAAARCSDIASNLRRRHSND